MSPMLRACKYCQRTTYNNDIVCRLCKEAFDDGKRESYEDVLKRIQDANNKVIGRLDEILDNKDKKNIEANTKMCYVVGSLWELLGYVLGRSKE